MTAYVRNGANDPLPTLELSPELPFGASAVAKFGSKSKDWITFKPLMACNDVSNWLAEGVHICAEKLLHVRTRISTAFQAC